MLIDDKQAHSWLDDTYFPVKNYQKLISPKYIHQVFLYI